MAKKLLYGLFCLMACVIGSCGDHEHDHEAEGHNHESEKSEEHKEHSDEIVLHEHQIKELGIKTITITPQKFREVIECGGEVLPSPSSQAVVAAKSDGIVHLSKGIVQGVKTSKGAAICQIATTGVSGGDPQNEARIRLTAAEAEYSRIKKLYDSNLATEKELRDAEAALAMARNAVVGNNSGSVAVCPIAGVVSQLLVDNGAYVTVGTPIAVVCADSRLTLRAFLPQTYYRNYPIINAAKFRMGYSEEIFSTESLKGRRVSDISVSPVANGYMSIDFEFDNNGSIVPGGFAEVFLLGAERSNVIVLSKKALIEEQSKYCVFVRLSEEHFAKRYVTIGASDGENVEILSGLKSGDKVVVDGAIYVKMAANTGAIPEGHHHH